MPRTRREERRETRRQEILDAALSLITEDGFDALTIARLAKRVDAAVGAIYRYFSSKNALCVALQIQAIEKFGEVLEESVAPIDSSEPLRRAVAGFLALPVYAAQDPVRHMLIDEMLSDPRPILTDTEADQVNAVLDPILGRCADLLGDCERAEVIDPGDALLRTHVLWASLHGVGHFRKRDPRQPPELQSARIEHAVVRDLFRGWGASPERIARALPLAASAPST